MEKEVGWEAMMKFKEVRYVVDAIKSAIMNGAADFNTWYSGYSEIFNEFSDQTFNLMNETFYIIDGHVFRFGNERLYCVGNTDYLRKQCTKIIRSLSKKGDK